MVVTSPIASSTHTQSTIGSPASRSYGRIANNYGDIARRASLVIGFYLAIALILMGKVIFSSGAIAGGDWSTPVTRQQFDVFGASGLFLWTHVNNLFGVAQPYLSTPSTMFLWLLSRFFSGPIIDRLFLLLVYTFAGSTLYAFSRRIGASRIPALVAGAVYVTTPVFFDFTAMGWTYVLLSFSLIPWLLLLFDKCRREGGVMAMVGLGVLMEIGFSFSTSCIAWYPLALFVYGLFAVRSRREFVSVCKTLAASGIIVILMNCAWILPFVQYGNSFLSSSASQTNVPLGQHLGVMNIIRGWGSLFNWPFEISFPASLLFISFVPPITAYAALLARRRDRTVRYLATLTLIPLLFFVTRSVFYSLPFTGVFRDISRLILFQAMASSILIAVTLESLWRMRPPAPDGWQRYVPRAAMVFVAVGLILSGYPAWSGELTGVAKEGMDIRLRTMNYPIEYSSVQNALKGGGSKTLYLPEVDANAPAFSTYSGDYAEILNPFASYAPQPGGIYVGDRRPGDYGDVESLFTGTRLLSSSIDISELIGALGIGRVVVLANLEGHFYPTIGIVNRLRADKGLALTQFGDAFVFDNTDSPSLIYASTSPVFHAEIASKGIVSAFGRGFVEHRRVALFADSASRKSLPQLQED
ncbi:MAG: hypothetical protein ACYCOU_17720, partial [Sulfobacillus sp.]